MRVLLVEDQPDIAEMYAMGLQGAGHEVTISPSAEEALPLVRDHPQLLLLDIGLPGMSGIDFLRQLRSGSVPGGGDLRVVMLTNYSDRDFRDTAKSLGALDYLIKADVRPSALVGLMAQWAGPEPGRPEEFQSDDPADRAAG